MANITDPTAVRFSNEKARVYADAMVTAYETAKKFVAEYNANNLSTLIPNDATAEIIDGARQDGRYPINGAHVSAAVTNANAVITWFETGTPSRIDRFRQMAVNGGSRF